MKYVILISGILAAVSAYQMIITIKTDWFTKRTVQKNLEFLMLALSLNFASHHILEFVSLIVGDNLPMLITNVWICANLLVCITPMVYVRYIQKLQKEQRGELERVA